MKWVTLSEELFVTRGIPETPQIFILRKRKTNVLNRDPVEGSEYNRPSHCLFPHPSSHQPLSGVMILPQSVPMLGRVLFFLNECLIIIIERCQKTWRKRSIRDTYRTLRKVSKTKYIIANQKSSSKSAAAGMDSSSSSLPWPDDCGWERKSVCHVYYLLIQFNLNTHLSSQKTKYATKGRWFWWYVNIANKLIKLWQLDLQISMMNRGESSETRAVEYFDYFVGETKWGCDVIFSKN